MTIKLHRGIGSSEESIREFEKFLGQPISEAVKNFLRKYDGAEPELNIFSITKENESGVNKFIPLHSIPREISRVRGISSKSYPIAWAEGGNYVVVDENDNGAVYFWDHELVDSLTKIANDFDSFLDQLAPFDPKAVKLNPGQVKKAWIDSNFLKNLKRE